MLRGEFTVKRNDYADKHASETLHWPVLIAPPLASSAIVRMV